MREITFKKADTYKVIAEVASYLDSLNDKKDYIMTIKEDRPKRSISANNYCWTLIDKLAEKLNEPKTEIYRNYIKEIGGNNYLVCCIDKAVDDLRRDWSNRGTGWLSECEDSKLKGCTNIRLYYGSSVYDTAQMSRLINLVVQDCKENGIETLPPEELERMKEEWNT